MIFVGVTTSTTSFAFLIAGISHFVFATNLQDDLNTVSGLQKNDTNHVDKYARFGEFPWFVTVNLSGEDKFATGSLIHPKVVLMAAVYYTHREPDKFKVVAGQRKFGTSEDKHPSQERGVEKIIRYFENPSNLQDDFNAGLLFLNEPFVLADHINTIRLPSNETSLKNVNNCVESTWVEDDHSPPMRLTKNVIKIISDEECSKEKISINGIKSPLSICGIFTDIDECQKLHGAPLVCPIADNQFHLVGIRSFGFACRSIKLFEYIDVRKIRHWIVDEMKKAGLEV